jgi:hypothetical protein
MVSKIRGDGRLDPERPHYYSQFWIDVAMGKQSPALPEALPVIEAEDAEDLEDVIVAVAPMPEPLPEPKPEPKPKPVKAAEKKPDARPTITSFADLANIDMLMKSSAAMGDDEAPDISGGLDAAPDISLDVVSGAEGATETTPTTDDAFPEELTEEEEEDEWGGGRRKPKPGKAKRHERREF